MTRDSTTADLQDRRSSLERWIAATMPDATSVELSPFVPATSGFSNVSLFTELTWRDSAGEYSSELVLRAQPGSVGLFPDYDLRLQYDVMAFLHDSPVPVPEVAWFVDDVAVLGAPAYLMHRVHGEVASGFRPGFHGHGLFFEASIAQRRDMWFGAVDAMAALHSVGIDGVELPAGLGPRVGGTEALTRMLDVIESQLDWADMGPLPVLREALGYLRKNLPNSAETVLCWGDARPGNIVYRDGEVISVLDWELAHLGAPEGDLAYFLLVDQVVAELNDVPRLPGLPDADETIAHYESRTSRTVQCLEFHSIMQALRLAALLVLTVRLSPPELTFPASYLTDNVPTRRLAALLGTYA